MKTLTPELEALLVEGETMLAHKAQLEAEKEAAYKAQVEIVTNAVLEIARSHTPEALHPFMSCELDGDIARVTIQIPEALPLTMYYYHPDWRYDVDDPVLGTGWKTYTNRAYSELNVLDNHVERNRFQGNYRQFPVALAVARRHYRPPTPEVPEPAKRPNLYRTLEGTLSETYEADIPFATLGIQRVIARALIDLAETQDALLRSTDR